MTDHEVYIFDGDPKQVVSVTVKELQRLCRELYADGSGDRGLGLIDGEEMNESLSELVTVHERTCHGTEYVSGEPAEYDCADVTYYCSGCGYGCSVYVQCEDGSTYAEAPRFCPHCGARAVGE